MPTYEVILKDIEIYEMQVEADSESEAYDKAFELIDTEEGKAEYHSDSDGECEAIEID